LNRWFLISFLNTPRELGEDIFISTFGLRRAPSSSACSLQPTFVARSHFQLRKLHHCIVLHFHRSSCKFIHFE
jgi:hypothetical protein